MCQQNLSTKKKKKKIHIINVKCEEPRNNKNRIVLDVPAKSFHKKRRKKYT
jgi:hypothetical protein